MADRQHRVHPNPFPQLRPSADSSEFSLVLVEPDHPVWEIVVDIETSAFPEGPDFWGAPDRGDFVFTALVYGDQLHHVSRLSAPRLVDRDRSSALPFLVRQLLDSGQGLTTDALDEWAEAVEVDVSNSLSVESQVRLGPEIDGVSPAVRFYSGAFSIARAIEASAVFAHLNSTAIRSFEQLGLDFERIAGRDDLRTPSEVQGEFDDVYTPVAIRRSEQNAQIEKLIEPLTPMLVHARDL